MAYRRIKMVLEIDGNVITEAWVNKNPEEVQSMKSRWMHTYAIKSRKLPYQIYVEIPSNMKPTKFRQKSFITNKINYEQVETIAECQ